jgi:hypothetical protein
MHWWEGWAMGMKNMRHWSFGMSRLLFSYPPERICIWSHGGVLFGQVWIVVRRSQVQIPLSAWNSASIASRHHILDIHGLRRIYTSDTVSRNLPMTAATISAAVAQRLTTSASVSRRRKWNWTSMALAFFRRWSQLAIIHQVRMGISWRVVTKMTFHDHDEEEFGSSTSTMPPFIWTGLLSGFDAR